MTKYQYPISYTKDEVPRWVNLKNRAYAGVATLRGKDDGIGPVNEELEININLPKEFTFNDRSQYQYGYTQLMNPLRNLMGNIVESSDWLDGLVTILKRSASAAVGWVDVQAGDSVFQGADIRKFHFNFDMVPKTIKEAESISKMCHSLRKQVYPTGTVGSDLFGAIHPSLWDIEIVKSPGGEKDPEWDLNFQLAVLAECIIDKMPEGPRAISNQDASKFSPSATKLTLVFFELEPNYFDEDTKEAVARSKLGVFAQLFDKAAKVG
jgi:hypothetical protein